jgi:hypothetical protein
MGQFPGLCCLRVLQQRPSGGDGRLQAFSAETSQRSDFELVAKQAPGRVEVEIPVRLAGACRVEAEVGCPAFRVENFRRADALQRRRNLFGRYFEQHELAARQIQSGDACGVAQGGHGEQPEVLLVVDQRRVGQCARRHDARHGALDRPLAGGRVADLLADHRRFAEFDQAGEVGLQRVERHAAHPDRHAGRLAARGQRDVEQARRLFGVIMEQLVEIAHPVEQQGVRMTGLERHVLAHHRRVLGEIGWFGGH